MTSLWRHSRLTYHDPKFFDTRCGIVARRGMVIGLVPRTGTGLSGKSFEKYKMFFDWNDSKFLKQHFFFKFRKFAKKIVFYSNHMSQIPNIWNNIFVKFVEKINYHFLFSKILPLYPIPVPEGGGGIGHSGDFSCAAHLLIDLRSWWLFLI